MYRKIVFNATSMKNRRVNLRRKSTQAEKILWERIRKNELGVKFFRQYSIEGYVVDFYCPEKRLAIEIEGSVHDTYKQKIYDKYRKRLIQAYNIRFLVFTNSEIFRESDKTIEKIREILTPPSPPLKLRGGPFP
jgi:very-short-patch-repair endonuclease